MEKLSVTITEQPGLNATLFSLTGAVDVFSYKDLKSAFDTWSAAPHPPTIMLDMSGVSYVGSSGWSVLFLQTATQEKEGGALVLFGMNERVDRSLNIIMPRKRHVNVAPDFEAAKGVLETLKNSAQAAQT